MPRTHAPRRRVAAAAKLPGALAGALTRAGGLAGPDVTRIYDVIGRRYAERPLLTFQEPLQLAGHLHERLTGQQFRDLGYRIAQALLQAGVTVNDRVVLAKSNHPDYLLYLYSTIAASGLPVSVNVGTTWEFIRGISELTAARFLITDERTLPADPDDPADPANAHVRALLDRGVAFLVVGDGFGAASQRWQQVGDVRPFWAAIERAAPVPPPRRQIGRDTPVAMFHTSGTTGTPKCCVWTRRNASRIWQIMMVTLPVTARSRGMMVAPFSHALFFALQTGALLCGMPTYLMSRFDPAGCLRAIERQRITHMMAFPYVYMRLAAEDLDAYDLSSMLLWSTGADKAHAAHIGALIRRGGLQLRPGGPKGSVFLDSYGSTEIGAGGIIHLWLPGQTPQPCVQGRPMPTQFGVRIVDQDWRDLPAGSEGRILVRSSTHFEGYWNNHDAWAAQRIDGWWWGGDVGRIDERGRLLFLDREADSVATPSGPVRTLPVEERLLLHPAVMEAAVFARAVDPAAGIGEPVAWVVPKGVLRADQIAAEPDRWRELEKDLLDWAHAGPGPSATLAAVRVVALDTLPLGVTGKVLKRRLRELTAAPAAELEGASDEQLLA
jgi:long-chain acyl-CoA synthetase